VELHVVVAAVHLEVLEVGRSTVDPVTLVVDVAPLGRSVAAGPRAATVAESDRLALGRTDDAGLAAEVEDLAIAIVNDPTHDRVARQPAHGARCDGPDVREVAARGARIVGHVPREGVDVDEHRELRGTGGAERPPCHLVQRVRTLLRRGALRIRIHELLERADDGLAGDRIEATVDVDAAVGKLREVQATAAVRLVRVVAVDVDVVGDRPPAAHCDPELLRARLARDLQQLLLVLVEQLVMTTRRPRERVDVRARDVTVIEPLHQVHRLRSRAWTVRPRGRGRRDDIGRGRDLPT
jgi:hypothetical protein